MSWLTIKRFTAFPNIWSTLYVKIMKKIEISLRIVWLSVFWFSPFQSRFLRYSKSNSSLRKNLLINDSIPFITDEVKGQVSPNAVNGHSGDDTATIRFPDSRSFRQRHVQISENRKKGNSLKLLFFEASIYVENTSKNPK